MKKKLTSLVIVFCMMLSLLPAPAFAASSSGAVVGGTVLPKDVGTALPKIMNKSTSVTWSATTKDNKTITQDTYKDKIQVLIFFDMSGTCDNSNETLNSLIESPLLNNSNIQFIAIGVMVNGTASADLLDAYLNTYVNTTSDKIVYAWLTEKPTYFYDLTPYAYAKDAGIPYKPSLGFPVNVVLGTDGAMRSIWTGAYTSDYYASVLELLKVEGVTGNVEDYLTYTTKITGTTDYAAAQEELALLNEYRSSEDLTTALTLDDALTEAAMQRAAEIAVYWSHTRPNYTSCFTVISGSERENIALGQGSPSAVMTAWENSPGHKANILASENKSVGIGCFTSPNGVKCWVQLFSSNDGTATTNSTASKKTYTVTAAKKLLDLSLSAISMNFTAGTDVTLTLKNTNQGVTITEPISITSVSSNDPAVATASINNDGTATVTGVGGGSTTLKVGLASASNGDPYTLDVAVTVTATPLTKSMFTVDTSNETYDGTAKTKNITSSLKLGTDYTVAYSNNTAAGTAAVTISGKGLYSGTLTYNFTIDKAAREISATAAKTTIYVGSTPSQIAITDNAAGEKPAYTYSSNKTSVASVSQDGKVSGAAAGTATITVSAPATKNYAAGSASVNFTVKSLPLQEIAFTDTAVDKTYGDAEFTVTAVNSSSNGGNITYASDNEAVAVVDKTSGAVTIKAAGEATIIATAAEVEGVYAATDASYTLTVAKKKVTVTADDKTMKYGETVPELTATVPTLVGQDTAEALGLKLTTTATSTSDVGGYEITGTGTSDNYIVTVTPGTLTVINADYAGTTTAMATAKVGTTATYDLSALLPTGAVVGTPKALVDPADTTSSGAVTVSIENSVLSFNIPADATPDTDEVLYSVVIPVTLKNYNDFNLRISVFATSKDVPTLTITPITKTYDGVAISSGDIVGTAMVGEKTVEGVWKIMLSEGQSIVNVADSGAYEVAFEADGYGIAYATVKITINKATPAGTPTYTKISSSGKTLNDAALTGSFTDPNSGAEVAGVLSWNLGDTTPVARNTSYGWTFIPTDAANYNSVSGSVTPWVSTGSAGSGAMTYSVTVSNETGGKVTANTTSASEGTTVTLTVTPDSGYELSKLTVTDVSGNEIKLTKISDTKYTFTMPSSKVNVTPTFVESDDMLDSTNPFTDVASDSYYYDAVMWAVEKGVTTGTSATTFGPGASCTRAQMMTFLWRAAGSPTATDTANPFADVSSSAYYHDAVLWAVEKGITAGTSETTFSPNATVTRGQTVTFLYHYAGSPDVDSNGSFTDVSSSSYYTDAVQWALENEVTHGTSDTTFSPENDCTRAQIVTFLYRYLAD